MKGSFVLCSFLVLILAPATRAQDEPQNQAQEQTPDILDHQKLFAELLQPQLSKRSEAIKKIDTWVKQQPQAAKAPLIQLALESPEPEIRERAISLLRTVAMSEYGSFGEGYSGIQMDTPSLLNIPGMGRISGMPLRFVTKDGPADKAGIKANDIIFAIDEKTWEDPNIQYSELSTVIRGKGAGTTITMSLLRDGKIMRIPVTLTRRPPTLDNVQRIDIPGGNFQLQGGNLQLNGGNLQFGGNIVIPQGGLVDQASISDAIQKDKESDQFFKEWLTKQKELLKTK